MKIKVRTIQSRRMPVEMAMEYLSSMEAGKDEIIVFPEKFITGTIDPSKLQNLIDSVNIENTIIMGSLSYIDRFLYNRSFIVKNGKIYGWQDKINLYRAESSRYTPGNDLKTFMIDGLKIGILVCYDLDFPDYSRMLFRSRCDIIFNPSLIRKDFHKEWHWYVKARALENRIPIVSVNSISDDFLGDSIIAYPRGEEGGVRLDVFTSKSDDIVSELDTLDYSMNREQRLKEENLVIGNVRLLDGKNIPVRIKQQ
jgi:predicted amidohydrolase